MTSAVTAIGDIIRREIESQRRHASVMSLLNHVEALSTSESPYLHRVPSERPQRNRWRFGVNWGKFAGEAMASAIYASISAGWKP